MSTMMGAIVLGVVAVMAAVGAVSATDMSSSFPDAAAGSRPNIIFLMADDLGRNDIGYSDPTVFSPNIDRLANEGVKLSTCYTWDWCAPSRGATLSGRYAPVSGYTKGADGPAKDGSMVAFPLKHKLIPQYLQSAGYHSIMLGKWHLGYPTKLHTPENRGFDEYFGYLTGAEDYYTHVKVAAQECPTTRDLWLGKKTNGSIAGGPADDPANFGVLSTVTYTKFITKRIREHAINNPSKPLFVYAAYQAIHSPLEVDKRFFDLYDDQGANQGPCDWSLKDPKDGFKCTWPTDELKGGANCYCNRLVIKAMVSALDEAVGNITRALNESGLANNTVFIFQGDNGGPTFEGHSNTPLRGGKLNFFEGGIRPAAFVSSPLLPESSRGQWYNGTIHETDWAATILYLAGAKGPSGGPPLDGINVWPTLTDFSVPHRNETLIANGILRVGDWKLWATNLSGPGERYSGVISHDHDVDQGHYKFDTNILKDCMLGTNGGWLSPPTNASSTDGLCPSDGYTRGQNSKAVKCAFTDGPGVVLKDPMDKWLCSNPCTRASPCLWNLKDDPQERNEVAAHNPHVVKEMMARLDEYIKRYEPLVPYPGSTDKFCQLAKQRGNFVGPYIDPIM
eukprot:m.53632 g.53632  ORF g.53632 m.53632 type:complete len:620 (-) comp12399_c0_seq1:4-1863(-)